MGFLDMFDNPNILSQLLGGGNASGAPPMGPPAPMPPVQGLEMAAPGAAGTAMQGGMPIAQGFDASAPTPPPAPPPPQMHVPLPPPRPNIELPPNATPTIGAQPIAPQAPMMAPGAPPMPPASQMQPGNAPPTMSSGGGLAAALGLNNGGLRPALAGVGRGLSAVGQMQPGTPAGQAFAAGAGGSLQGAEANRTQQEQLARQKQNDLFTQSSTAFKDMLAAKNSDNTETYRQAQSKYLMARAQSLMTGGTGSNAWQNTPYGKVIQVENEAQKFEKGQQILLQKRWTLNGATPDQQQKDLDQLAKNTEAYRKRLYGHAGIDPDKAAKLKDMGTSSENPFDTKGMSLQQFHDQVPMGAWYKDQNGVARQRTVPPPGQGGAGPQSNAAPSGTDDYMAMTPAA